MGKGRWPSLVALCAWAAQGAGGQEVRIHMVTFATEQYIERFRLSLDAKERYAGHWGYSFEVYDESSLDCSKFRSIRWRGDYRYCKLEALKVAMDRIEKLSPAKEKSRAIRKGATDYIFWHDVDTHIMRPEVPLHSFVEKAGGAPFVLTDNVLSLNNGVFFAEVSPPGLAFVRAWREGCATGEWPWADNGCMYEVMLKRFGGDSYKGRCLKFMHEDFQRESPEPRTGAKLMRCFNAQMRKLGHGCCGTAARNMDGVAFLTGVEDSFNHHTCESLHASADLTEKEKASIGPHCFVEGMFMVHAKQLHYAQESMRRVDAFVASRPSADEL